MGQRLIITEEERNEILKLHKSFIFEGPDDVLGNQGTPVSGAINSGPGIVNTVNQPGLPAAQPPTKITQLQNKLNQKFKSGLTADGKWGSKTANAVLSALKGLSTPPAQQPPAQQPTAQQPTAQQPPAQQPSKLEKPLVPQNNATLKNPGLANPFVKPKNPLNQPLR
jgi:hypothetical protein